MKRLLIVMAACALAQTATAQNEAPVPVERAAFHVPMLRNDLITVVNVFIPPGRAAGYHTHSHDQLSVVVQDSENGGQVLGEEPYAPRRTPRGSVSFTAFSKKPLTHRVNNAGTTPFHNIVTTISYPQPGRFTPGDRSEVPGYQQIIDNERVRVWRLTLEPGQSAPGINQKAPGLRIVVDGGEIAQSAPGLPDQAMVLKLGEFYWQEPGTRAVRNSGTTKVVLIEFELK